MNIRIFNLLAFAFLLCFTPAISRSGGDSESASKTTTLNIPAVAGKSASEVAKILGEPTSTETTRARGRSYPKSSYHAGAVEIVFVDGKADWITVFGGRGLPALPYSEKALDMLGLSTKAPTFSRPGVVMRWGNISGLREVSLFPAGSAGKVDYAYILVRTEP